MRQQAKLGFTAHSKQLELAVKVKWQMAPFRRCASDLRAHGHMLGLPNQAAKALPSLQLRSRGGQ